MKLSNLPLGTIDWMRVLPEVQKGETGSVANRVLQAGDTRIRLVEYGGGYLADHWCHKGHVIHVLSGELMIEHEDGSATKLIPGVTWHAGDGTGAPHRVRCAKGATVFVVD